MSIQPPRRPIQRQEARPTTRWYAQWLSFLRSRADSLLTLAGTLIPAGVVLLVLGTVFSGGTWLSAVGAAMLGAGLTIVTSAVTSAKAVREQYSKEANIQRKREIYGPLHAELKQLSDAFAAARDGSQPWLQWIAITGKHYPEAIFDPSYTVPTLQWWPALRADYRIENFQETTRALLDDVHHLAALYDDAVMAAQGAAIRILTLHVVALVREARAAEQQGQLPSDLAWVTRLIRQQSTEEAGAVWGRAWIASWPIHQRPATLGWLLAGNIEKAAAVIRAPLIVDNDAVPPIDQLEHDPTFQEVRRAENKLVARLHEAERLLESGLQYIRDRYEGGHPPV